MIKGYSRDSIKKHITEFVLSIQGKVKGEFCAYSGGPPTLYASCFAGMTLHYLDVLSQFAPEVRQAWAEYILQWQNPHDGLFIGPELTKAEISSSEHNWEVVAMHLTAHVLPVLDLLGAQPRYPLAFAHKFLDSMYLKDWLYARDWRNAWLEGNNLLFVGQFLIFLRDIENQSSSRRSIEMYFDWLDEQIDPLTGLWGTNGYCSPFIAMCGAYHQLLVYFYEDREILYPERLVDSVLKLQELDGGFSPSGGGGACEDVDAISILVNLYQRYEYKRPKIRHALRRACESVLKRQTSEGGFVYRWNEPFIHMSVPRTHVPVNMAHPFATWFGVHTLALLSQVLTDEPVLSQAWKFNKTLSMGWHLSWDCGQHQLTDTDQKEELETPLDWDDVLRYMRAIKRSLKQTVKPVLKPILQRTGLLNK